MEFVQPAIWEPYSVSTLLDPAWAEDQKRRYPGLDALIDSTVEGARNGDFDYLAGHETPAADDDARGWIIGAGYETAVAVDELLEYVEGTLGRQVDDLVLPGQRVEAVMVAAGQAARLDWRFSAATQADPDGVARVRSYWLTSGTGLVALQLTAYGVEDPEIVEAFDAAAQTMRWKP